MKQRRSLESLLLEISLLCALVLWPSVWTCGAGFSPSDDKAVVTTVYDGDTLRVRFEDGRSEIVRLIGINAPELSDQRDTVSFLAHMSKRFAFTQLYRQKVRLEYDWELRDQYDRLLVYVFFHKGIFNEYIVREGFAAAFLKYPFQQKYRRMFSEAEKEARVQGRGMWREGDYPLVKAAVAKSFLGKIVRIQYVCSQVEKRGRFWVLQAQGGDFAALIDQRYQERFPAPESLLGKRLTIRGFLEAYRGQPQILVFLPSQIE